MYLCCLYWMNIVEKSYVEEYEEHIVMELKVDPDFEVKVVVFEMVE